MDMGTLEFAVRDGQDGFMFRLPIGPFYPYCPWLIRVSRKGGNWSCPDIEGLPLNWILNADSLGSLSCCWVVGAYHRELKSSNMREPWRAWDQVTLSSFQDSSLVYFIY